MTETEGRFIRSVPDWLGALRREVESTSIRQTAKKVGYSNATISLVMRGSYTGDLKAVEQAVSGALMQKSLSCPVVGDIAADICLKTQRMPFSAANPQRVAFAKACQKCVNFNRKERSC